MTTADFATLKDQWTTYAQSLRLWALDLLVWFATVTKWRPVRLRAQQELRFLRAEVRQILLSHMAIELVDNLPKQRKRRAHVRERLGYYRSFKRYVLRGIRLRTFDDAKCVLEHLEKNVARCVANFRAGMKVLGLLSGEAPVAVCAHVGEGADAPDSSELHAIRDRGPMARKRRLRRTLTCGPQMDSGGRGPVHRHRRYPAKAAGFSRRACMRARLSHPSAHR